MVGTRPVVLVYAVLPHYRYGVFTELQARLGTDFALISGTKGKVPGLRILTYKEISPFNTVHNVWIGPFLWQRGLLSMVFRNPDAIHVFDGNYLYLSTWCAALLLRARRRPVVYWTIGWHRHDSRIRSAVRRSFYGLANHLLVYGQTGYDLGIAHGYQQKRMTVIYNSHDSPPVLASQESTVQRRMSERKWDYPVLGAVIRLTARKNLHLLVRAASELKARGREMTLLFGGDGPVREDLKRLASELDVDAYFLGEVYGEINLSAVYDQLNISVVPSAAGLTAVQSMVYGVPVISDDDRYSQMPEWESIIPGVTGEHYQKGDFVDLANKIELLLAKLERNRGKISEACRQEVASNWNAPRQAERIVRVLDSFREDNNAP